jgi:hypothetical protein
MLIMYINIHALQSCIYLKFPNFWKLLFAGPMFSKLATPDK